MPESTSTSVQSIPKHCVMVPFLNRHEQVSRCMDILLTQANEQTVFLLVDDGSTPEAMRSMVLQPVFSHPNVHLIHHTDNLGVTAARNSGIDWCRREQIELLIMIDSDCIPESDFIDEHIRLHNKYSDVTCIGGRIVGEGKSFWAKLDGATSWIHSSSHNESDPTKTEFRRVEHPYHLATTNFSVKMAKLPQRDFLFDERLISGEDCLLVRELRRNGQQVYFSSTPRIFHKDRERLRDVFQHHYEWGHHQYFIQLGGDISPRCFNLFYRVVFMSAFLPLLPLFALMGSVLNAKALWRTQRGQLSLLFPFIYLLWIAKGIAVLEAAFNPDACLRQARNTMEYEVALFS